MRIRSVTLRNYRVHRDFVIKFDPARTLIGGPNGGGKSTIVEAMHRALFLKAKGNTEHHRAMVSSLHPGHPEVEIVFEAGGREHVLKKRFGTAGTSTLSSANSSLLAGDAAESELARLLGVEAGVAGKALIAQWGHLWIWQGQAGEDPSSLATVQRDGLLRRLQVIGGAAAIQSALDATLAEQFAEAVEGTYTQVGRIKAGSDLERAESAADAAAKRATDAEECVARLDSAARQLETATQTLQSATGKLAELEKEREQVEAKTQRLAVLRQTQTEQLHAVQGATSRLGSLQAVDVQILEARAEIGALERKLGPLEEAIARQEKDRDEARARAAEGEQTYRRSTEAARAIRLRHELACAFVALFERTDLHRTLATKQEEVDQRRHELGEWREQLAKLPAVDRAGLNEMRKADAAYSKAHAAWQATATGLEILAADQPVTANGQALSAGAKQILTDDTEISIGSTVRLRIQPGGGASLADARRKMVDAQNALKGLLDAAGLKTVEEAAEVVTRRDDLQSKARAAEAALKALGAENVEKELQSAHHEVAAAANVERLKALASGELSVSDKAAAQVLAKTLAKDLEKAQEEESTAVADRERLAKAFETAQASAIAKRLEAEQQQKSLIGLRAQLTLLLRNHGEDEARGRELITWQSTKNEAELRLKAMNEEIVGLEPELLEHDRLRIVRAIAAQAEVRDVARDQIANARAELRSEGQEDPRAALAAARAQARLADDHRGGVRRQAEAVRLLAGLFCEEQRQLSEQFTKPLVEKISGYLQCIFGPAATAYVELDQNNEFSGLCLGRVGPGDGAFAFEALSGGTKEQMAAAVRLAIAEVLAADHGGCLPVVFDDAFAYSDPERVNQVQRMLDLAATRGIQVIVLTCNPADYSALGAQQIILPPVLSKVSIVSADSHAPFRGSTRDENRVAAAFAPVAPWASRRSSALPLIEFSQRQDAAATLEHSSRSIFESETKGLPPEEAIDLAAKPEVERANEPATVADEDDLGGLLLARLRSLGGRSGNQTLREALGWDEGFYNSVKEHLLAAGRLVAGRGKGGSVALPATEL